MSVVSVRILVAQTMTNLGKRVLPFEYHCAHVYYTFSAIVKSTLKIVGSNLSTAVLMDFAEEYGRDMANRLILYEHVNFNVLS